jgi:hypothetical protein
VGAGGGYGGMVSSCPSWLDRNLASALSMPETRGHLPAWARLVLIGWLLVQAARALAGLALTLITNTIISQRALRVRGQGFDRHHQCPRPGRPVRAPCQGTAGQPL